MEKKKFKNIVVALLSREREDNNIEYLLVSSKKDFGQYTGCWYPPGGHIEEIEEEKTALVREMQEELGLKVEPIKKIATTPSDIKDQITHWWRCKLLSEGLEIDREEIANVGWFTKDEMKKIKLWPATKNFFQEHIFNLGGRR